MNGWQKVGEQDTGNWWTNDEDGISAFEDMQDNEPCWYAWVGTWEDHDREIGRSMTETFTTRDEAVAGLRG